MQTNWTAIDAYIESHLIPPDTVLEEALRASEAAGLPAIQVSPSLGKLLQLLAMAQGARSILEIGTLAAYSTIWLARALPPDGRLLTLENEPTHAAVANDNVHRAGLAARVELRLAPALETLANLPVDEPFDLIFIDANKDQLPDYLEWSIRLSRPGTIILADNVVRGGEILDPTSSDSRVQGVRRFYEMLERDVRVEATAIQTVGCKGHDGLAVIRVSERA